MKDKIIKALLTGVSTIVLGALGSALWELALKPFFEFILPKLILLFGFFSDHFYKQIAMGGHLTADLAARYFLAFLALAICVGPKKWITMFQKISDTLPVHLMLAFIILFACIFSERVSSDITANTILRNIEIVAPYISDDEYKILKSDFYSMDTKNDFETLQNSIMEIREENNL